MVDDAHSSPTSNHTCQAWISSAFSTHASLREQEHISDKTIETMNTSLNENLAEDQVHQCFLKMAGASGGGSAALRVVATAVR